METSFVTKNRSRNSEQNVVLLLFLFTLDKNRSSWDSRKKRQIPCKGDLPAAFRSPAVRSEFAV